MKDPTLEKFRAMEKIKPKGRGTTLLKPLRNVAV